MSVWSELDSVSRGAGRRSRGGPHSSSCRSSWVGERRLGSNGRFGWKGASGALGEGRLQVKGSVWLDGVHCSHRMPGVCWKQGKIQAGPISEQKTWFPHLLIKSNYFSRTFRPNSPIFKDPTDIVLDMDQG